MSAWIIPTLMLLGASSALAQATKLVSYNSLSDGARGTASAIVKVISQGPPGSPQLASSGLFFRDQGEQFVVTTSHGLYHSAIIGQFYAINIAGEKVPCGLLASSYEYDLAILQCKAPNWQMGSRLEYSQDEADYYRPSTKDYYIHYLMGYPADAESLRIETRHNGDPAMFYSAPRRMIVPAVKAHYLVPSDHLEPGMSGGVLLVGSRDYLMFGGLISKKMASQQGRSQRAASTAGVIPASYVRYMIQSTLHAVRNGRHVLPGQQVGPHTITRDLYEQLEHPLNVRVNQFSYQMSEKAVGNKRHKIIRVIPDENINLNIEHSPYRGVNDFKRAVRQFPGCALSVIGEFVGIDNGYEYVREDFFGIDTYEGILSFFILAEGQTNWMGLRGAMMRIDCPNQAETLRKISEKVQEYKTLTQGLDMPYAGYIKNIEEKVLSPEAESLFPRNFVLPYGTRRPCDTNDAACNRLLKARHLIDQIGYLTASLYQKL